MFEKILIANRGAIARRVIRACRDLGVSPVAVYSDADAHAPYLAEADYAFALPGSRAQETYLNQQRLIEVIAASGADAVHPGYGFLAESAAFAKAVRAAGAAFIGPEPRWLEALGDKVRARAMMADAGFPTLGGSERLSDVDAAVAAAVDLGYPLILKPCGGGGGIGMQVVADADQLRRSFARSGTLAGRAFSDRGLYLERYLARPRHVEFQVLADGRGGAMHLYERDCSIQRRHQKVIEEAPAPGLDREALQAVAEQAAGALGRLGYDNVATVETLSADGKFGFLEVNTRIQVEHGVTELVTGLDLVSTQIRLAAGEPLPRRPPLSGHAMEARVYAEDPVRFLASTGVLSVFRPPRMTAVRVETGYAEGQAVTPYYDPLLAKVLGVGATRAQAIGRLLVGLKAFEIRGVPTNLPLLIEVLGESRFLEGDVDTHYLDERRSP